MNRLIFAGCVTLLAGCTMNEPADTAAGGAGPASLETALAGYEQSGPPVSCVNRRYLGSNYPAGEGAIIFRGQTRSQLWVNRPTSNCPSLAFNRTLITNAAGQDLCRGDIAQVVDLRSRVPYGGCTLGEFTPFRRR